jgi:ribosome-associated toxin RatA of RatAB toxin-antitoxin module
VLVPYRAQQMFELVDQVEQYPQFLPWCGGARVVEHGEGRKTARLDIGLAKGKKQHDKRAVAATRDWNRDKQRLLRHVARGKAAGR